MLIRLWFGVGLVTLLLFSPWWVWVPIAIGGILYFYDFYEAVLLGGLADLTYASHAGGFMRAFPLTLGLLLTLVVVEFGRKYLFVH